MPTALDMNKLKQIQKNLEDRSSGSSSNWITQADLKEAAIEVHILEPTPDMDGYYFLEVPIWWINGKKIISPEIFGGQDIGTQIIKEVNASQDKEAKALLVQTKNGMRVVQKSTEYWLPVLQFEWKFNKTGEIEGIYDDKGNYDPELISQFVKDDRFKVFQAKISLLTGINSIATSRGGAFMTDKDKGFNLILSKTGEKKKTKYHVNKANEVDLPMPAKFYEDRVSLIDIAKAQILTDECIDNIFGVYLYGEEEIEDVTFAYPEVREALKNSFNDSDEEEAQSVPPQRGGRPRPAAAEQTAEKAPKEEAPVRGVSGRSRGTVSEGRSEHNSPAAGRGRGRNLADDIKETNDD